MALFVLSSKDGWVNIMYTGLDAVGVDQQPIENYNEWRLLYFISFLLLVAFFVLNMFVGVVVENFHRCRAQQDKEERAARAEKRARKLEKRRKSIALFIRHYYHYYYHSFHMPAMISSAEPDHHHRHYNHDDNDDDEERCMHDSRTSTPVTTLTPSDLKNNPFYVRLHDLERAAIHSAYLVSPLPPQMHQQHQASLSLHDLHACRQHDNTGDSVNEYHDSDDNDNDDDDDDVMIVHEVRDGMNPCEEEFDLIQQNQRVRRFKRILRPDIRVRSACDERHRRHDLDKDMMTSSTPDPPPTTATTKTSTQHTTCGDNFIIPFSPLLLFFH